MVTDRPEKPVDRHVERLGERRLSMSDFIGLTRVVLDKGRRFRFRAWGNSMTPFIRDWDVITITPVLVPNSNPVVPGAAASSAARVGLVGEKRRAGEKTEAITGARAGVGTGVVTGVAAGVVTEAATGVMAGVVTGAVTGVVTGAASGVITEVVARAVTRVIAGVVTGVIADVMTGVATGVMTVAATGVAPGERTGAIAGPAQGVSVGEMP